MAGFVLQTRDREVLDFLRDQGFATSQQLEKKFFPSRSAASKRMCTLERCGYLTRAIISDVLPPLRKSSVGKRFFPYLLNVGFKPDTIVYRLSDSHLIQVQHSKKLIKAELCLHQLLLNDVRSDLEKELKCDFILNDPKLTILADIHFDRRKEFTPDLSFEGPEYKFAVELERTKKDRNRYSSKFYFYSDSAYTHVLYVYVNDKHLRNLLQLAGVDRKFAFAHYRKPTELLSNTWGHLTLDDFVERVNRIRKR